MTAEFQLRSIYRSILRELPARPPSAGPSPLRTSVRNQFAATATKAEATSQWQTARRQEADQFIQYLKAQRMYSTLIERYNPGMGMDEQERVRLTARRVGMDMPEDWYNPKK